MLGKCIRVHVYQYLYGHSSQTPQYLHWQNADCMISATCYESIEYYASYSVAVQTAQSSAVSVEICLKVKIHKDTKYHSLINTCEVLFKLGKQMKALM